VTIKATVDGVDYSVDTVLSTALVEWTPDRAVTCLRMTRNGVGSTTRGCVCDGAKRLERTAHRGVSGHRGAEGGGVVDPGRGDPANTVPANFTATVKLVFGDRHQRHLLAVVQPAAAGAVVANAEISASGYVSVQLSRCATADVATESAALGADALAATRYPQTIIPMGAEHG